MQQVKLVMEGLDITMIVEGRELVSLKLQSAALQVETSATIQAHAPLHALVIRLTVEDMVIEDLQVGHRQSLLHKTHQKQTVFMNAGLAMPDMCCFCDACDAANI